MININDKSVELILRCQLLGVKSSLVEIQEAVDDNELDDALELVQSLNNVLIAAMCIKNLSEEDLDEEKLMRNAEKLEERYNDQ